MKVAILGGGEGWHARMLAAALERRGLAPRRCPISQLTAAIGISPSPIGERGVRPAALAFTPNPAPAGGSGVPDGRAGVSPASLNATDKCHRTIGDPGSPVLSAEERLDDCDLIFVRAIPIGSLEQIIFRMDVLHRLALGGVRIVNGPRCLERTVDKYLTSALLAAAGLPTPRTIVAERFDAALAAFATLGGDVVVKPLFGSEGKGIVRVSDPDLAYRTFRALELARSVFYLQEFIPHRDEDIRAFVVGGEVVAAMRRRGRGWKTNVSQGARPEPVALPPDLAALAVRAAAVVEADYAGVDLLVAESGDVYVLEVNGIPGWAGLQRTTAIDLADRIVAHALASLATPVEPTTSASTLRGR